jgi:signal transduction histidine kinase
VDLTAYRVVQEALTNVQKHVGPGAHAEVRIVTRPDVLEVTVTDDGDGEGEGTPEDAPDAVDAQDETPQTREAQERPQGVAEQAESAGTATVPRPAAPADAGDAGGGGHGLMGMRERAAALHGECETGPLPEGGFRVHVRLPLRPRDRDPARTEEGASA